MKQRMWLKLHGTLGEGYHDVWPILAPLARALHRVTARADTGRWPTYEPGDSEVVEALKAMYPEALFEKTDK